MIAYLEGRIIYGDAEKSSIILKTNGVGYEVFIPAGGSSNLSRSSGSLSLFIYTYVREDRITLYGFHTSLQREIFSLLLEVKDVGPKLAVTILSGIDAGNFLNILTTQDISALSQIKGIGKAKAERIVMELKNKILRKPALMNNVKAEALCDYNDNGIEDAFGSKTGSGGGTRGVSSPFPYGSAGAGADNNLNSANSVSEIGEKGGMRTAFKGGSTDNYGNRADNAQPSDVILESSCVLEALGYSRLESLNLASKVYKSIKDEGIIEITTESLTKGCLRYMYSLKNEAGSAEEASR